VAKRILLVEGKDDKHVVYALRDFHGIPDVFDVKDKENAEQLLESLPVELKGSDLERLAVILDADEDVTRRWIQLKHRLGKSGGDLLPETPNVSGTIIQILDGPLFAVWFMPDNRLSGMLEDFLTFLVPKDDELLPRVDGFIKDIPARLKLFPAAHTPKARLHAWLAVQEKPGLRLGTAITAKFLKADNETTQPFIKWLRAALVD
jgi:hypothetical protein